MRSILIEALIFATPTLVALVLWLFRKRAAQARLMAIEAGELCVKCGAADLSHTLTVVSCQRCGYRADFARLRATKITAKEIAAITRPARRMFELGPDLLSRIVEKIVSFAAR